MEKPGSDRNTSDKDELLSPEMSRKVSLPADLAASRRKSSSGSARKVKGQLMLVHCGLWFSTFAYYNEYIVAYHDCMLRYLACKYSLV